MMTHVVVKGYGDDEDKEVVVAFGALMLMRDGDRCEAECAGFPLMIISDREYARLKALLTKADVLDEDAEGVVHKCGTCGRYLTKVRPGKFQCDWCEGKIYTAREAREGRQAQNIVALEG
jgi:hypothetical protein